MISKQTMINGLIGITFVLIVISATFVGVGFLLRAIP
jgi:hypothetical protein